jgi:hypothetical protein
MSQEVSKEISNTVRGPLTSIKSSWKVGSRLDRSPSLLYYVDVDGSEGKEIVGNIQQSRREPVSYVTLIS